MGRVKCVDGSYSKGKKINAKKIQEIKKFDVLSSFDIKIN
jgi:hypothetical protein